MTTKITPFGTEDNGSQILEFNVSIPKGANTSIAPNSTLTVTQRFAEVYNQATTGAASYRQVTKLDVVHNLQYVDCRVRQKLSQTSLQLLSTLRQLPLLQKL